MLEGVKSDALIADKAYDSNAIRHTVRAARMKAVIPSNRSRKHLIRHDKVLYRERNRIERGHCTEAPAQRFETHERSCSGIGPGRKPPACIPVIVL